MHGFSAVNGISYGSYCCKHTKQATALETDCNKMMSGYVKSSIAAIERVIPKVVSETTISLKVMQEMDTEMHTTAKAKYGIETKGMKEIGINFKHYISAHFNVNAKTKVAHTELDMVYTLLGVPNQTNETTISFFFQVTGQHNLWFNMNAGFNILYSAHLLTHRQQCPKLVEYGNINISAYTPKRLLHNFAMTYRQILKGEGMMVNNESTSNEKVRSDDELSSVDEVNEEEEGVNRELLAFAAFLTGHACGGRGNSNYFALLDTFQKNGGA